MKKVNNKNKEKCRDVVCKPSVKETSGQLGKGNIQKKRRYKRSQFVVERDMKAQPHRES